MHRNVGRNRAQSPAGIVRNPSRRGQPNRCTLRDSGIRPLIELEHTGHPLAIDRRTEIELQRALEIAHQVQDQTF